MQRVGRRGDEVERLIEGARFVAFRVDSECRMPAKQVRKNLLRKTRFLSGLPWKPYEYGVWIGRLSMGAPAEKLQMTAFRFDLIGFFAA